VGSFLLAFAVAGGTVVTAIRSRRPKQQETVTQGGNTAVNCGTVSMGPDAVIYVVTKNRWWQRRF
jgi:hypothetical protein